MIDRYLLWRTAGIVLWASILGSLGWQFLTWGMAHGLLERLRMTMEAAAK